MYFLIPTMISVKLKSLKYELHVFYHLIFLWTDFKVQCPPLISLDQDY